MPKSSKPANKTSPSKEKESSQFDRAPRQKNEQRNPVMSAEQTRDIPTQHGAIK